MRKAPGVMLVLVIAFGVADGSVRLAARREQSGPPPADTAGIVARALDAMGGRARLEAIETLRLETVNILPTGTALEIDYTFTRPNRERKEVRGRALIEYDGTRISVQALDPAKGPQPPRFEPAEKNRDFEIEIGYYIPAFLDYPAEAAGTTEVDGRLCHQLRLTLPLGSRLTYAIDASTHLIARVRAEVVADGKLTVWGERTWSDYRTVQGIQYPQTIVSTGPDGSSTRTTVKRVEVHSRQTH